MTVYVDKTNDYSHKSSVGSKARIYGTRWCHLYADNLEELHAMAEQIGLQRKWFQDTAPLPHYDLTPSKRQQVISFGAIEDSDHKIMVAMMRKDRAAKGQICPKCYSYQYSSVQLAYEQLHCVCEKCNYVWIRRSNG